MPFDELRCGLWLTCLGPPAQVKASYKLSEEFKKGPAKPKKVAKAKVSLFFTSNLVRCHLKKWTPVSD